MYNYRAFGLNISSEIIIEYFHVLPESPDPDVEIHFGEYEIPYNSFRNQYREMMSYNDGILLYWKNIGAFWLREGKKVIINPTLESPDYDMIRAVVTGAILGIILYQRGDYNVFHSSAVARKDDLGAVAFIAQKGGGKSSIAAAMMNAGYSMVSDDLLAVRFKDGKSIVQPGFPGMKLWDSSAAALVPNADEMTMIGKKGVYEKKIRQVGTQFIEEEILLNCIFILEFTEEDELKIVPLTKKEALLNVMLHWYGANFQGQLLPILGKDRLFKECADLVSHVPVYRLIRPKSLERIDESVGLIDRFRREHPLG